MNHRCRTYWATDTLTVNKYIKFAGKLAGEYSISNEAFACSYVSLLFYADYEMDLVTSAPLNLKADDFLNRTKFSSFIGVLPLQAAFFGMGGRNPTSRVFAALR